jgi:hypothetical protein
MKKVSDSHSQVQLPSHQFSKYVISLGSTRIAVLDTDYLLNQIRDGVQKGGTLFLVGGPPLGNVRAFASSHVLQELYQSDHLGFRNKWEKLANESAVGGWPREPKVFEAFFKRHFLNRITFVDVAGVFEDEPSVQEVRKIDPKDAPTAQLTVLLSRLRPFVYSHDKSLQRPGLAPDRVQFQAVLAAGRDLESGESTVKGATFVGAAVVWGVDGATSEAAAMLKVPRWVPYLVLASTVIWMFIGAERREKVVKVLKPVGKFILLQAEVASNAAALLNGSVANVPEGDQLECRIAEVLAQCTKDEHLLAREIQERILQHSPSLPRPTVPEIRSVLTKACFVQSPRYRYKLGETYVGNSD